MATSDGFRQSDEGEQETTAAYRGWNDLPNELNDEIFPYIWRFVRTFLRCSWCWRYLTRLAYG